MPDPARLFAVQPLETLPFQAMVVSLSYERPDEWLPHLPTALGQAKIRGRVLLDLLACNGNTKQRYFSVQVNPQTGRLEKVQRETGAELTSISAPLLAKLLPFLDLSLLSPAQQHAVHNGTPLPSPFLNPDRPE